MCRISQSVSTPPPPPLPPSSNTPSPLQYHLTERADFNVGSHINTFLLMRCKTSTVPGVPQEMGWNQGQGIHHLFWLVDVCVCMSIIIMDVWMYYNYKIMEKEQKLCVFVCVCVCVSHLAGLYPRAWNSGVHLPACLPSTYTSQYKIKGL